MLNGGIMIKFDPLTLAHVENELMNVYSTVLSMRLAATAGAFTTVPSINAAFTQHQTIWAGQAGSAVDTIENIRDRIRWVHELFSAHISGFSLQEELSKASLDNLHSKVTRNPAEHHLNLPTGANWEIQNVLYTGPVAAGEAATPLAALIAAFQGDDAIPLLAAKRWHDAGHQLGSAMASLNQASNMIAASAQGSSFDAARAAIGDLVKLGTIVSANTRTMAASVSQFPTIRATNLAALQAIQTSTAAIPAPAERLAAEQAAVASFVSSHLQPSLELVKPPVTNLGVPVATRSGGGALNAGSFGESSTPSVINAVNGHVGSATPTTSGAFADQSARAVSQAGHAAPTHLATAPASAPAATPTPTGAAHLSPAGGPSVGATSPASASPISIVPPRSTPLSPLQSPQLGGESGVRPAGVLSRGAAGTGASKPSTQLHGGTQGVGDASSVKSLQPGKPTGQSTISAGNRVGASNSVNPRMGSVVGMGNNPANGTGRLGGSQRLPRLPFAAQAPVESNVVRGTFGGNQGATGVASAASGRGLVGVGGKGISGAVPTGGRSAGAAKVGASSAKLFSFNKADRDYFTRQFMGKRKKTVRKVITGS